MEFILEFPLWGWFFVINLVYWIVLPLLCGLIAPHYERRMAKRTPWLSLHQIRRQRKLEDERLRREAA